MESKFVIGGRTGLPPAAEIAREFLLDSPWPDRVNPGNSRSRSGRASPSPNHPSLDAMIIWGSKAKVHAVGTGGFYCPSCNRDATYVHQRVSRYFTLYFIPLFPMSVLGEYICCDFCRGEFKPDVLRLTREQIAFATTPWSCTCGNRNSPSAAACLSCGKTRSSTPPPLPGAV